MNIILNADDFGESESVNRTILELHQRGIVSSTTIIAKSKHFDMAVKIAKDNPRLGVGVHLCLDGPFNIGKNYQTILKDNTRKFFNKYSIINKLKKFAVNGNEIYREYCLQIEKVLDSGIHISHLDHHHHLYLYLPALNAMIKACRKFKIKFIRSQRIILHQNGNLINRLYRYLHQYYVKKRGLHAIDGYFEPGILHESKFDKYYNRLRSLFEMNCKTVELVLHPKNMNDPETKFFTSKKVLHLLNNHNIINYFDLKNIYNETTDTEF
jgi:predicted glycoside hydrolase/deacetylase ChbG (UPF0249 family)